MRYLPDDGDYPAAHFSWNRAAEVCFKLTERERILPHRRFYSLPSREQWEYACRAGTSGPFAGASLEEMGWYSGNSGGTAHPVGAKRPNPWGIHDMHGNVWEWCNEWIRRGGGFRMGADRCRSAYAFVDIPELGSSCSGARIVALLPGGDAEQAFLDAEQQMANALQAATRIPLAESEAMKRIFSCR